MRQRWAWGVLARTPATAQAADPTSVKIKITVEGYDGNDPIVLGTVTLKNLLTGEEWGNATISGNEITCETQEGTPGTYACMIDGKIYGYQLGPVTAGSEMTTSYTFYSVYFMNGAVVYETKYVSKKEFLILIILSEIRRPRLLCPRKGGL